MNRLNNNRTSGSDELPGEIARTWIKCNRYANSRHFQSCHNRPTLLSQIGHGILVVLPKPGKPVGAMTILIPIVFLSALCKTLSLIMPSRIADKVDQGQSGFRRGCNTADVLFFYRWLTAKTQRVQKSFRVLRALLLIRYRSFL